MVTGTRMFTQLLGGSRRWTITSIECPGQLGTGTFNSDAFPVFKGAASPALPATHGTETLMRCASPPPRNDETSLVEAGRRGALRTWPVEIPKAFIRRTQGKCGAAKEATNDVLGRSVEGVSSRDGGAYQDDTASDRSGS
jgi:hypothetical protein